MDTTAYMTPSGYGEMIPLTEYEAAGVLDVLPFEPTVRGTSDRLFPRVGLYPRPGLFPRHA